MDVFSGHVSPFSQEQNGIKTKQIARFLVRQVRLRYLLADLDTKSV